MLRGPCRFLHSAIEMQRLNIRNLGNGVWTASTLGPVVKNIPLSDSDTTPSAG
jgi:hypothetical protein